MVDSDEECDPADKDSDRGAEVKEDSIKEWQDYVVDATSSYILKAS